LEALNASLDIVLKNSKLGKIKKLHQDLTDFLRQAKIEIVADKEPRSAAILTIKLKQARQSEKLGSFLQSKGIFIHYKNHYLLSRNWIQVGFFSASNNQSHLNYLKNLITEFFMVEKR